MTPRRATRARRVLAYRRAAMRAPRLSARRPALSARTALPAAVAVIAVATIVVGAVLVAGGRDIGAPLPPTLFRWRPHFGSLAPLAAALLAAGVVAATWLRRPAVRPLPFALAALGLALALRLSLNAARAGPVDWWIFFDPRFGEGTVEYLAALPALDFGPLLFLDRFAEIASALPVHAAGHPPGLLIAVALLGLEPAPALAALTIVSGALAVPLVYLLGRRLLDSEHDARAATLLFVFAPGTLVYGASAADTLFASLATLAALALVARARLVRLLGGPAALALASFFSYANLAVGAWAALTVWLREGWASALRLATAVAAGLLAFYAALYLLTGFDLLGAVAASQEVYRVSIARIRPYAYFVFGAPIAWLRSVAANRPDALALAAIVVVSAVAGFTKAETERIWLFLVPLACTAGAASLPRRWLAAALAALAVQAFLMQVLLGTVW